MVAAVAIALGTKMIGSTNDTALDAALVPVLIAALALAARLGREAAQRRRGEKAFGTSAITLSRFLYLGCAALAAITTVSVVAAPALARFFEILGV